MAFKMKGFPLIEGTSPAKKYVSDAQRKAVHASKAEKSATKFNEGLRKASAEGKLDDNPKFKAAVDKSPMNRKSFMEKADKKYAKDKDLQRKMTKALKKGKSKKAERIGKRRTKVQEKAQELEFKEFKAGENSPTKLSEKDKKKAMDNAMPEAKVRSRTYQDLQADKKAMKDSKDRLKVAKQKAATGGDPEKAAYNKAKARERKIQSQLNVSPLKVKKGDPASVTRRKNEGDAKGARLERRRGKAAAKGNTSKAKRLARKLKAHDATDNRGKQKARTTEVKKGGRIQF
tara:strand:+ start:28 stop:891 length:864 start_codon:yes stop_codon:yes gene_type:complete